MVPTIRPHAPSVRRCGGKDSLPEDIVRTATLPAALLPSCGHPGGWKSGAPSLAAGILVAAGVPLLGKSRGPFLWFRDACRHTNRDVEAGASGGGLRVDRDQRSTEQRSLRIRAFDRRASIRSPEGWVPQRSALSCSGCPPRRHRLSCTGSSWAGGLALRALRDCHGISQRGPQGRWEVARRNRRRRSGSGLVVR
jgi:hypothetical protein